MNDYGTKIWKSVSGFVCLCRPAAFIVFLIWTYDKLVRPEHGMHMMQNFYYVLGLAESAIMIFGVAELAMCILFVLGFFQEIHAGIFSIPERVGCVAS